MDDAAINTDVASQRQHDHVANGTVHPIEVHVLKLETPFCDKRSDSDDDDGDVEFVEASSSFASFSIEMDEKGVFVRSRRHTELGVNIADFDPANDVDDPELGEDDGFRALSEAELADWRCFPVSFDDAKLQAGHFVRKIWEASWSWKSVHFNLLPPWLQDNDYLHTGHRPELSSFNACFTSIFRLHTETANIWTHMIGAAAFVGLAAYFLTRPDREVQLREKAIFSAFFIGAISCMGFSFTFHTVNCHSQKVGKIFNKLDYCGIAMLIMGSFVPWLFYGFYCRPVPMLSYMVAILVLGSGCIVVSLWNKFSEPKFRPLRAGLFIALGLSALVPFAHYLIVAGFWSCVYDAALGWMVLMGAMYIFGALLYASRIPERFFPGKCDLWFHSHQLFHMCVVTAAFVHYHGITEMAMLKLNAGTCEEQLIEHLG